VIAEQPVTEKKTREEFNDPKVTKIHFPDLDGWRFVAFLGVFFYHSFYTEIDAIKATDEYRFIKGVFANGNLGVDFFFVLSGFLIIYLLISERNATGKIDIRKFYVRRVLRIFPLYYLCLVFGFLVFPLIKHYLGAVVSESADIRYYLFFLSNFDIIRNGVLPDAGSLGVLWSISVEEQFYLTVPLILVLLPTRLYPWMFSLVIILSIAFRIVNSGDEFTLAMHTLSFAGNLAVGGLLAYLSITNGQFVDFFRKIGRIPIALNYLGISLVFLYRSEIFPSGLAYAASTIVAASLFGFLILEQTLAEKSFFKMRNNNLFTRMGKYTYGLYCLHIIAALFILQICSKLAINTQLWQIVLVETPLMLLLSVLFAFLSYNLFEKRFLKLKERFSFQRSRT